MENFLRQLSPENAQARATDPACLLLRPRRRETVGTRRLDAESTSGTPRPPPAATGARAVSPQLPRVPVVTRWRFVWPVLVAVLLVRLAAGLFAIGRGSFLEHDGEDYHDLARNLAGARGYLVDRVRWFEPAATMGARAPGDGQAPDVSRPPLVPLVLAVFYAAFPASLYVAAFVSAAVGTLTCLVVAVLARDLWGRPGFGAGLVLAGAWPVFIYYSARLSTEAMMSLLLAALVLSMVALSRGADGPVRRSLGRAALAGGVLGLSALCRPTMLAGFATVPLWAATCLRAPSARRAALAGVVLLAAVLTILPWTARNRLSSGEFIPVTNLGGYVFWLGNNEDELRAYASLGYAEFLRHQGRAFEVEGRRLVAEMANEGLTSPRAQERFWMARGLGFVREHPAGYVFLCLARLGHFFRPWLNPAAYGRAVALLSLAMWGVLYTSGALGFARLWRKERAAAAGVASVVLAGAAAHALTHVMIRHRVPFVDTAAVFLAPPVLLDWARRLGTRFGRWRRRGIPGCIPGA